MTPAPQLDTRYTAPLALAAGGVAVLVMALWGMNALTAPFEDDEPTSSSTTCGTTEQHTIKRSQVTVSVYNSGKRKGRAGVTLDLLESAGFQPGAIGNAPKGVRPRIAVIRTTKQNDAAAALVARAFGSTIPVVVTQEDLGPGIDVIIGDRFNRLSRSAPKVIRSTSGATC